MFKILRDFFETQLRLPQNVSFVITEAIEIILWIIFGFIVSKIVKRIIYRLLKLNSKTKRSLTISKVLISISNYVIWFIVVVIILSSLNVDITPIIASAGVVGLAVGFGAQEIVRDFITGFFIIFENTFNVGEIVEVDGFIGTVIDIGLRTTKIQNWKGAIKIINNGDIRTVINYSQDNSLAVVDFGVSYNTDIEKIEPLIKDYIKSFKDKYTLIVEEPIYLGVTDLSDSSVDLRIIAKCKPFEHFQVERDIRRDLKSFLEKNNITIAYPQIVVHKGE